MKAKVFLTRAMSDHAIEYLQENVELDMNQEDRVLSKAEVIQGIRGKNALICNIRDTIDADIMDSNPNLKIIANVAVGYNNVDIEAASARQIIVTNTPGVLTEATADMTWALLMAVSRRLVEGDRLVRSNNWSGWEPLQLLGEDISGSTIGIIGMGRIGKAVARRARSFYMNVCYWNRTRLDLQEEKELGLIYCSLDELLQKSDYVSLHLAYTKDTHHFIKERELSMMKKTAYFINTARGAHVDEKALVYALKNKTIAGAGLDVYEHEPRLEPGLVDLDNAVLAPHLGSATHRTRTKMGIMAVNNVLALFNGLIPPNAINKF